jgi:hypothetical protein
LIVYDDKFEELKPVESKPVLANPLQMQEINQRIFSYFGVNEAILQNKYDEPGWNAFYEGRVEPFALQLGLVMSNMIFTHREIAQGNSVIFSSNRLQYASNQSKLSIATQLVDRGIMNQNEAREIFNLGPIPGGEIYRIRKEYTETQDLGAQDGGGRGCL